MNLTKLLLVAFIAATVLVLNIAAQELINPIQGAKSLRGIVSSQNSGSAFRPSAVGVKDNKDEGGKAEGGQNAKNPADAIRERIKAGWNKRKNGGGDKKEEKKE